MRQNDACVFIAPRIMYMPIYCKKEHFVLYEGTKLLQTFISLYITWVFSLWPCMSRVSITDMLILALIFTTFPSHWFKLSFLQLFSINLLIWFPSWKTVYLNSTSRHEHLFLFELGQVCPWSQSTHILWHLYNHQWKTSLSYN